MSADPALHTAIVAQSDAHILPLYKRAPVALTGGQGAWLEAADGRRFLDGLAGIAVSALGHGDPGVTAAIQQAASGLLHTSNLFYTEPPARLAERLISLTPWAAKVYFGNSGTEAIEAALKFARRRAHNEAPGQRTGIVACNHAFHGRTLGALSVTAREAYRTPFLPLLPDVAFMPLNADAATIAAYVTPKVGAVILEPIQGEGGIRPATPEFLHALRARCDEVGATLIFDEIQCGLGRTGDVWAHTASGVTPDIMAIAKPLANGLPIGATLVNQRIADAMSYGDHGTTFGGNPLICAVADVVVSRVAEPAFLAQVQAVGAELGAALRDLGERFEIISDVRGRGLMWGVEFAGHDVSPIIGHALEEGLICAAAGPDVVRLVPPLIINSNEARELATRLGAAVAKYTTA